MKKTKLLKALHHLRRRRKKKQCGGLRNEGVSLRPVYLGKEIMVGH
jgi:hypothetical protein